MKVYTLAVSSFLTFINKEVCKVESGLDSRGRVREEGLAPFKSIFLWMPHCAIHWKVVGYGHTNTHTYFTVYTGRS